MDSIKTWVIILTFVCCTFTHLCQAIEENEKVILSDVKTIEKRSVQPISSGHFTDAEDVLFKLKLAAKLRDNLVNVLGYIIYLPVHTLHLDKYASLIDIYRAFRTKRLRTVELLTVLQSLSTSGPHKQLLLIFTVLKNTRPIYLTGAVNIWLKALTVRSVDMDQILRPNGGPLAVDLLAGIDIFSLARLSTKTYFPPEVVQRAPKDIVRSMGLYFARIFSALHLNSLPISTTLIGLLLLHVPIYKFIAEVDEAQRYLHDILVDPYGSALLRFAVDNFDSSKKANPYALVNHFLFQIINSKGIDPMIYECAEYVYPHFQPLNLLTLNPQYYVMIPIVKNNKIVYDALFRVIAIGEYPEDIVQIKNLLLTKIHSNELNMGPIMRNFVLHDYPTPYELLIAVLDRIKRRGGLALPDTLRMQLNALIIHVKLKYYALNADGRTFSSFDEFKKLFDAFFTEGVSPGTQGLLKDVLASLSRETIDWKKLLEKLRLSENSNPRNFIKRILSHLIQATYIQAALKHQINKLLNDLALMEEAKQCPQITCPDNKPTIRPINPVTTESPIEEPSTWGTPPPRGNVRIQDVNLKIVFEGIIAGIDDLPDLKRLQEFVMSTINKYLPNFNVNMYKTVGPLLKAIFDQYLALGEIQRNPDIIHMLTKFKTKINMDGIGSRPIPYIVLTVTRTVDMSEVFDALDRVEVVRAGKKLHLSNVFRFLQTGYFSHDYATGFASDSFKTKGQFLVGFFNHLISHPDLPKNIKISLKELLRFIKQDGPGSSPVPFKVVSSNYSNDNAKK